MGSLVDRKSAVRIRYQKTLSAQAEIVRLLATTIPPAIGFRVGCIQRHQVVQVFVTLVSANCIKIHLWLRQEYHEYLHYLVAQTYDIQTAATIHS
jgi:hypothetical protein